MTASWEQEVTAVVLAAAGVTASAALPVRGMCWTDVASHWLIQEHSTALKVTSLPQTPHFTLVFPRCFSLKHIISNCTAMSPRSESTLKHQTWFWSQEDVEPAENSWRGEVRPSVLQKCGDAAKPGKRTRECYRSGLVNLGRKPTSASSRYCLKSLGVRVSISP